MEDKSYGPTTYSFRWNIDTAALTTYLFVPAAITVVDFDAIERSTESKLSGMESFPDVEQIIAKVSK